MIKIVISYIYAGKENEGWDFYNNRYRISNKEIIRADILKNLKDDHAYNRIYNRQ
jgi:hypothetical protein